MANSTTNIDTISSGQLQPEVTANQYFDSASPATLFGRRGSATSLLTWAYYGGRMLVDGVLTTVVNGTVTLTASNTNYVEATRAGVVSCNTTGFTAGRIPLYTVVVGASAPTSYTDERTWVDPAYMTHQVSVSITTADVTLTAAQARCRVIVLSGALTGNRNLIVPNNGEWIVVNNTSGSYTVTVKTSAGTGVEVAQSTSKMFLADGTNVISPNQASSSTFGIVAVSGQSNVVADTASDTLTLAAGSGITLTTDAATDTVTITNSGSASNSFETIAVSGQSNVVADSGTDTLTFVAGSGMTITTDAATDSITFASSGGSASNSFETIAVSGQSNVVADSSTDTLTLAAGSGITITTNATTDTITIAASGGGAGITLGTPQNSTSGTSIDFTGIPAGTKRIVISFIGISTNGSSTIMVQLGDSGGFETTGYLGCVNTTNLTTGIGVSPVGAVSVLHGSMALSLADSATFTWSATCVVGASNASGVAYCGASKSLSAELTQVRITTVNGTDTFDAGVINIQYQ
jgi:hypothetical protein